MLAYSLGSPASGALIQLPEDTIPALLAHCTAAHSGAQTLRMQAAFEAAYTTGHNDAEKRRRARTKRLGDILASIADAGVAAPSDVAKLTAVHADIAAYVRTYLSVDPAAAGFAPASALAATASALEATAAAASAATAAGGATVLTPRATAAAAAATSVGGGGSSTAASLAFPEAGGRPLNDVAQREMQAALDSVFPRVGVRPFLALGAAEKTAQLDECAHLVLGIRLFNWSAGRGGTGIEDTAGAALAEAGAAAEELDGILASASAGCAAASDALLALRTAGLASALSSAGLSPEACALAWPAELARLRQVVAYASALREELAAHAGALASTAAAIQGALQAVREVAGSKAAVSKEAIYPRFHNLAAHWLKAAEIREAVSVVGATLNALAAYAGEATAAAAASASGEGGAAPLSPEVVELARQALASAYGGADGSDEDADDGAAAARWRAAAAGVELLLPPEEDLAAASAAASTNPYDRPQVLSLEHSPEFLQLPLALQGFCPVSVASPLLPGFVTAPPAASGADDGSASATGAAAATALCLPATAALPVSPPPCMGLLLPGDPAVGVLRWRGSLVVCSSPAAAELFCAAPAFYLHRVAAIAAAHVELVHLLQLLAPVGAPAASGGHAPSAPAPLPGFPEASLGLLVAHEGDVGAAAAAALTQAAAAAAADAAAAGSHADGGLSPFGSTASSSSAAAAGSGVLTDTLPVAGVRLSKNGRKMVDACVDTPVHFVERAIDHRYEWNEWALRRKALAMVRLRQCITTSAQTDASHFRRDNDAQVYLPKETGTQTGISVGTNTTKVVRYVAGLRGAPEEVVEATAARRGIAVSAGAASAAAAGAPAVPAAPIPVGGSMSTVAYAAKGSVSVTVDASRPAPRHSAARGASVSAGTQTGGTSSSAIPEHKVVPLSVVTLRMDI